MRGAQPPAFSLFSSEDRPRAQPVIEVWDSNLWGWGFSPQQSHSSLLCLSMCHIWLSQKRDGVVGVESWKLSAHSVRRLADFYCVYVRNCAWRGRHQPWRRRDAVVSRIKRWIDVVLRTFHHEHIRLNILSSYKSGSTELNRTHYWTFERRCSAQVSPIFGKSDINY